MSAAPAIAAVVVLLAVVALVLFVWRLRSIAGRVGSFECGLRTGARALHGVAVYTHDQLVWYDVASLSRHPKFGWDRDDLVIEHRSAIIDGERQLIAARCSYRGQEFALTTDRSAFAGLVSWLEAAPPGTRSHRVI